MKLVKGWYFWAVVVPAVIVFRAFLQPGTAAWKDVLYLYPEVLEQWVSWPKELVEWASNFGEVNNVL